MLRRGRPDSTRYVPLRPGFLADLEHVPFGLPPTPWRGLGAREVERLLPLGDVGQDGPKPLVLNNRGLVDLLEPIEGPIRQIETRMADRQTAVRVVDHRDTPARQRPRHLIWLEDEEHLVVLQGEIARDGPLLFPGEHVIQPVVSLERAVGVAGVKGDLAKGTLPKRRL